MSRGRVVVNDRHDATPKVGHILAGARAADGEVFHELVRAAGLRLERIVSPVGHRGPPDEWFDQDHDEWVLVVQGRAAIAFEDGSPDLVLNPGDYLHLPAHRRHRVAWTDREQATVWLALHYGAAAAPD